PWSIRAIIHLGTKEVRNGELRQAAGRRGMAWSRRDGGRVGPLPLAAARERRSEQSGHDVPSIPGPARFPDTGEPGAVAGDPAAEYRASNDDAAPPAAAVRSQRRGGGRRP